MIWSRNKDGEDVEIKVTEKIIREKKQQTMFKWFTWGYVFLKATYKCIAGFWQMKLCCVYFKELDDIQLFSTSSITDGAKSTELLN